MKKAISILMILCLLTVLSGCSGRVNEQAAVPTLPPIRTAWSAPDGDGTPSGEVTHLLWLPGKDGTHLVQQYISLPAGNLNDTLTAIVTEALGYETNGQTVSLGGAVKLTLFGPHPVELSRNICTINLGSSALSLSSSHFYTAALSLATTLCELPQVSSVNILVADQSVGLDITGSLPMGNLTAHEGDNLQVLWEQTDAKKAPIGSDLSKTSLNANVTVYYPLEDGQGITCKAENVTFEGQTPQQMTTGLLKLMSERSAYVNGVRPLPDLCSLMLHDPLTSEMSDGGRLITLSFREDLPEILKENGMDLPCLMASIAYTMTTFIPGIAAICVRIGEKPVTALSSERFGNITLLGGMMRRNQFDSFLTEGITVYYISGGELQACEVPIIRKNADNPREQMAVLLAGPSESERERGMSSALPPNVFEDDILGVSIEGDTLLINLSENFRSEIQSAGPEQEMLLCYSMVNTLCKNNGVRKVCFFFEGEQVEQIAGDICWAGEFMYNPGLGEDSLG